jgi:ABC-type Mn2+/Zn2+ transport system ATPase subunit
MVAVVGYVTELSHQLNNSCINLKISSVGSGKTSFVSALLGEIPKVTGYVTVVGKVAYVSQQPWIKNDTVR